MGSYRDASRTADSYGTASALVQPVAVRCVVVSSCGGGGFHSRRAGAALVRCAGSFILDRGRSRERGTSLGTKPTKWAGLVLFCVWWLA